MAWPPPVLPINRTNADPQQDTHPNDHNAIGLAINDIVAELGPDPSGIHQDIDTRLDYEMNRTHIAGNDHWNDGRGILIQGASTVVTLDAVGNALIGFPQAFHELPVVTVSQGDAQNTAWIFLSSYYDGMTTVQFTVHGREITGGTAVANTTVRVNWIAIGLKTS